MKSGMKALILAAGLGTRLRPLTDAIPKPMIPIGGKPLLEHHIEHLAASGIKDICINLHYLPEHITDYFGDGANWGVQITYKFEPDILGTAGAIKNFQEQLSDPFLLLYGDMLHRVNLSPLIACHKEKNGLGTLVVNKTDDPVIKDIVELGEDQRVLRLITKPHDITTLSPFQWNMQAIYVFSKKICDYIPAGRYVELDHEVLPEVIQRGEKLFDYETQEPIFDIGTWENYQKAEQYLAMLS